MKETILARLSRLTAATGLRKIFWSCLSLWLATGAGVGHAQPAITRPFEAAVVIDPGHGGRDAGAQGGQGLVEKEIVLNLALLIAEQLDGKYQVVLTRTGDYWLDIAERTAVANHARAALFVSLHTGGSFRHQAAGPVVYCYAEAFRPLDGPGSAVAPGPPEASTVDRWDDIQKKHVADSHRLAALFTKKLDGFAGTSAGVLQGAPLMVLKGADMPAVVFEVGYLTHPADEKRLQDPAALKELAVRIAGAIHDFLAKSK